MDDHGERYSLKDIIERIQSKRTNRSARSDMNKLLEKVKGLIKKE